MSESTEAQKITSIIPNIDFFFIRNYRKRLFQKSIEYKKYLAYIEQNPLEVSKLSYGKNTIQEERRVIKLFSKLIDEDFHDRCEEEYRLDLIDLMTEDCIIEILNAYEAVYTNKFKQDVSECINIVSNIFYVPITRYISVQVKEHVFNKKYDDTTYTNISINIFNDHHHELAKLIGDKIINLDEIKNMSEFNDIYHKACELLSIKDPENFVLYIEKENWSERDISTSRYLYPMESKMAEMSSELKKLSYDFLKKDEGYSEIKTLVYDLMTSMKIKKMFLEYHFYLYLKQHFNYIDNETRFLLKTVQEKNYALSGKIDNLLNFDKETFKLYDNILKKFGISDTTAIKINEQDKPQITEELKSRVIGLHLYDIVSEERKTIPVKIIRNDPILKEFGYTEDDKQKLNNYLKTARRCVKYGMILPTKS